MAKSKNTQDSPTVYIDINTKNSIKLIVFQKRAC